jgi:hypothetical protein
MQKSGWSYSVFHKEKQSCVFLPWRNNIIGWFVGIRKLRSCVPEVRILIIISFTCLCCLVSIHVSLLCMNFIANDA